MGDKRRFEAFANFIQRVFPARHFPRVLDVAGGGGYLSLELMLRGYDPVLIEPRKTNVRRKVRKKYRRAMTNLERRRVLYRPEMAKGADLVVGMHPDGATKAIAESLAFAPVAVVPCCNYWPGHIGPVENAVRDTIQSFGECWESELDIEGKNLVLMGRT